jgi:hypothetical protein
MPTSSIYFKNNNGCELVVLFDWDKVKFLCILNTVWNKPLRIRRELALWKHSHYQLALQQATWDFFERILANKPELIRPTSHNRITESAQRIPYERSGLQLWEVQNQSGRLPAEVTPDSSQNTSKPRRCHICYLRWPSLHTCHIAFEY